LKPGASGSLLIKQTDNEDVVIALFQGFKNGKAIFAPISKHIHRSSNLDINDTAIQSETINAIEEDNKDRKRNNKRKKTISYSMNKK